MENVPLPLDLPEVEARPSIEVLPDALKKKRGKPIYRRLDGSKHKCDDCLAYSVANYPHDPVPLQARWERRVRGHGATYHCTPHKNEAMDRDHA